MKWCKMKQYYEYVWVSKSNSYIHGIMVMIIFKLYIVQSYDQNNILCIFLFFILTNILTIIFILYGYFLLVFIKC
jgi:hypothetical protein